MKEKVNDAKFRKANRWEAPAWMNCDGLPKLGEVLLTERYQEGCA